MSALIIQALNQPLMELLIYFSQEGVNSTIVYKRSQPQAKLCLQNMKLLTGMNIDLTHVDQKTRCNLKEPIRHSGLRSPIYGHR